MQSLPLSELDALWWVLFEWGWMMVVNVCIAHTYASIESTFKTQRATSSHSLFAGCDDARVDPANGSYWAPYIASLWPGRNVYILHFHHHLVFNKGK